MAKLRWWQTGIIYQIYPRSFQDSDGDGIGDLNGILQRLDYLAWLGVDAIWLSPIFPSPMADFGYDISDYTDIDAIFGTLADFDRLLDAAHRKGLKVILDFVPNHTSDQHPWFLESRSSRASPKRDWYIWRDAAEDGGPPNNWLSVFGGPAWTWDEASRQYYYHAFLKEQPDLNWQNREVREAMYDVLRFWLERGVDGFRVDVIWHLIKDGQFRDNPPNPRYRAGQQPYAQPRPVYTTDRPEVHEVDRRDASARGCVRGPRADRRDLPAGRAARDLLWRRSAKACICRSTSSSCSASGTPERSSIWSATMKPCCPTAAGRTGSSATTTITGSRAGSARRRHASRPCSCSRCAARQRMYYGDEIGMQDAIIPPELVQDPFEKRVPGIGVGRDPARTPMQWDASAIAGFTRGTPWLPVADGYRETNVAAEADDPRSMLALYRRLIELRRQRPELAAGDWRPLAADGDVLVYARSYGTSGCWSPSTSARRRTGCRLPNPAACCCPRISIGRSEAVSGHVELRGNEGIILPDDLDGQGFCCEPAGSFAISYHRPVSGDAALAPPGR